MTVWDIRKNIGIDIKKKKELKYWSVEKVVPKRRPSRDLCGDKPHRLALCPAKILERIGGQTDDSRQPTSCACHYRRVFSLSKHGIRRLVPWNQHLTQQPFAIRFCATQAKWLVSHPPPNSARRPRSERNLNQGVGRCWCSGVTQIATAITTTRYRALLHDVCLIPLEIIAETSSCGYTNSQAITNWPRFRTYYRFITGGRP